MKAIDYIKKEHLGLRAFYSVGVESWRKYLEFSIFDAEPKEPPLLNSTTVEVPVVTIEKGLF